MLCPICGAECITKQNRVLCSHFPICNFSKTQVAQRAELKEVIAFDLETTGLSRSKDKIIEIGALKIRDGQIVDSFETLLNPGLDNDGNKVFISSKITGITGITNDMVRDAASEEEGIRRFIQWCEGIDTFMGHNIIKFDIPFFKSAAKRYDLKFTAKKAYDTMYIAREVLESGVVPDYKQTTLASHYGIQYNAHRALEDIEANYKIFLRLEKEGRVAAKEL